MTTATDQRDALAKLLQQAIRLMETGNQEEIKHFIKENKV